MWHVFIYRHDPKFSDRYWSAYLSTFWKLHRGENSKMTIFNGLFMQNARAPKVMTISMVEIFENFIWFNQWENLKNTPKNSEMPLRKGDLVIFGKIGRESGSARPKIGRLTIYGGELTGMGLGKQCRPRSEQSDHGLYCLLLSSLCIFWMRYSMVKSPFSNFRVMTTNFRVSEFSGFLP